MIALDIDGTITAHHHHLEPDVIAFLEMLSNEGWTLVFITGRPFQWGASTLSGLNFPYLLAVQNGALILEMPQCNILSTRYLSNTILPTMASICNNEETDCVIYSGYNHEDKCYYRPKYFSPALLKYVQKRVKALNEDWQPINDFNELPISSFASVKCFAKGEIAAQRLAKKMEDELNLHTPIIRDPFDSSVYVLQGTRADVHKGQALLDIATLKGNPKPLIAAGDDWNDKSLLEVADIAIAMETAPKEIQDLADIIAPAATSNGIIEGLKRALKQC